MRVRSVLLACVCIAFLAAPAAGSGAITANSSSPLDMSIAAREALQTGDTATAIAGFSEAIESRQLSPEQLANALINRGFAYQRAQEHDRAIDDYTAALRIDAMTGKLRATALYNRGLSQQKLEHPMLAIEDFTSALFLEPEFAHAYYLRGTILRENGQYLFALSDFDKAIRFNHPQPHLVYYAEALTYEALRRPNDVQAMLNKAVAANPGFEPARSKLAAIGVQPAATDATVKPEAALVTAAVSAPEQIARKETLPEAMFPPSQLVGGLPVQMVQALPVKPRKLIDDRIPPEEAPQVATIEPAAAQPAKAPSESNADDTLQADATAQPHESKPKPVEPAPQTEQIVAVEALPEPEAQEKLAAAEQPKVQKKLVAAEQPKTQKKRAAAEQPEPAPAAPTPDAKMTQSSDTLLKGWSVQLSSLRDEKLAWGTWEKLKARHKPLSDMTPVVIKADLGAKGIYYRLRVGGFDTRAAAQSACGKLKSRGLSCFVSKADS
jgi:tetratricopeptide (TPR) repeat protein